MLRTAPLRLALAVMFLALFSCAKQAPLPLPDQTDADSVWNTFLSGSQAQAASQGFLLNASLNYSGPKRSHRLVIQFWGSPDLPLRMDLLATVGTIVSSWREDIDGFSAYFPDEEAVYIHPDARYAMEAFGFSFPLSLEGFGRLLTGSMRGQIAEEYESVEPVAPADMPDDDLGPGFEYTIKEDDGRYRILLDLHGRLVRFITPGVIPWVLTVSSYMDDEGFPHVPAKIRMTRSDTETAILRTKKLEFRETPWPEANLALEPPAGTEYRRIR